MRNQHGTSLIELLTVLATLAILMAGAYPAYSQYVTHTRRVEAQAALHRLMQQEERYFTRHNSYIAFTSGATDPDARQFQWWTGVKPAASAYEVEAKACDGERIADCVQLIAKPGTAQVDTRYKDEECEQLILTSTGLRLASGSGANCWR